MSGVTIVGGLDVAELVFYIFFIFFIGLIIWLRREDRREGYPLEEDIGGRLIPIDGPLQTAPQKTFRLPHGLVSPPTGVARDPVEVPNAVRTAHWSGSPIEPVGDPLSSGVGPAAFALRADTPDLDREGHPRIVPMALADGFFISPRDPDPRGWPMAGFDRVVAGTIEELWIDRSDHLIRFYQVALTGGGRALVPRVMCKVDKRNKWVECEAVLGSQIAGAPVPASPTQLTLQDEDRITGYFGGGYLYATPGRAEPFI